MSQQELNSEIITSIEPSSEPMLTQIQKLIFAKSILLCLAILFIVGMLISVITNNPEIFNACKTILPPRATLIIGYYFGEKS